jgi:hypothetical protein
VFDAVSIRSTATDHGGIIYHAPPASNYLLTAGRPAGVSQVQIYLDGVAVIQALPG